MRNPYFHFLSGNTCYENHYHDVLLQTVIHNTTYFKSCYGLDFEINRFFICKSHKRLSVSFFVNSIWDSGILIGQVFVTM